MPRIACSTHEAALYASTDYSALVDDIRERLPHAAIGSDVIVGFPGETDDDFERLTAYLEQSPLTHLHVFPYSDRPGTVASVCPARCTAPSSSRARNGSARSHACWRPFREAQRGTSRPALTIEDGSVAVTDNYFRVPVPPGHARNEWVTATVSVDDSRRRTTLVSLFSQSHDGIDHCGATGRQPARKQRTPVSSDAIDVSTSGSPGWTS